MASLLVRTYTPTVCLAATNHWQYKGLHTLYTALSKLGYRNFKCHPLTSHTCFTANHWKTRKLYTQLAHFTVDNNISLLCEQTSTSVQKVQTNFFSTSGNVETLSKMADNIPANSPLMESTCREEALKIFECAVSSVLPRQMIDHALKYDAADLMVGRLIANEKSYKVSHNVYVVGFGKAVLGMARAVEDIIGDHIVKGILSVPVGIQQCFIDAGKTDLLLFAGTKFTVHEGARHNLPDRAAHQAAMAIHTLANGLKSSDLLIVLISGGGSSLLPFPCPPISLDEVMTLTRLLSAGGATIQELNTARKNIEVLKGGGLALAAQPAQVISLVLSDVIGDPLDIISSGPTYPDSSTPSQCFDLFEVLGVADQVPESITTHLSSKLMKKTPNQFYIRCTEAVSGNTSCDNVQNIVVGSNKIAINAASVKAKELGYISYILSTTLQGDASEVGKLFATLARMICLAIETRSQSNKMLAKAELDLLQSGLSKRTANEISAIVRTARNGEKSVCIIAGGETTVNVKGKGKGGRNQEMVLSAALAMREKLIGTNLEGKICVQFLSAGTDGIDGPTDAAGAIAGPEFCDIAEKECFDAQKYLDNNDSYSILTAVNQGRSLVRTGHTGTNVMDVQILLVKTPPSVV